MKKAGQRQRWNDVTIAELVFFERLGTFLLGNRSKSMVQVAEATGFTNAHCHNTLAKLESLSRFGKRLVDRQNISLTKEGGEVLVYARSVLSAYRLRPFESGRTMLRIAATNRVLTTLLASRIPAFLENFKSKFDTDVDIEILEATFEQVLAWLELGEVELAFGGVNISGNSHAKVVVESSESHPKLVAESLREELHMVLVAPPKGLGPYSLRNKRDGMKVSMKSLDTTNLCLIRRDLRGDFRALPPPAAGYTRIVVDNYSSVLAIVRSRAAVGLLIDQGIPSDLLKFEFSDSNLSAQNFAVWHRKGIELSDAATALKDSLGVGRKKSRTARKK